MPTSHPTNVRSALAQVILTRTDLGSTNPNAKFRVFTAGFALLLIEYDLQNPAWETQISGVLTAYPIADATAINTGNAAVCILVDRAEVEVFRDTVGLIGSGAGFIVSAIGIIAGDLMRTPDPLTYTAPP